MKEKYIYKNGLIYTNDITEKKSHEFKIYDYQDNIDEILIKENIIEDLEKYKKEVLNNYKKINNNHFNIKNKFIRANVFSVLFMILIINSINSLSFTYLTFITLSSSVILTFSVTTYIIIKKIEKKYKEKKKYYIGIINKINEELKTNNKKLSELKKEKTKDLEDNYKNDNINIINYKERLLELKTLIKLYGEIFCNEEKYKKYYNLGILDKNIEKNYNENERKLIKEYFNKKNNLF